MTDIVTQARDSEGLCHTVVLRDGRVLRRDLARPSLWHGPADGHGPALLRDHIRRLSQNVPAVDGREYERTPPQTDLADAIRSDHGRRFLWTFGILGDGVAIHDEIDDPSQGRYRFRLDGGASMPTRPRDLDPILAGWFGTGPNPDDVRRTYAAAAYIVHLLNHDLGARTNTISGDPHLLGKVPRRPWRALETEDQIFINDAYDVEIMSLRTPHCRAGRSVSPEAARAADTLLRLVNTQSYA
jgi:hypothetical protein